MLVSSKHKLKCLDLYGRSISNTSYPNVPLQAEPIKVRIVYDCNGVVETSFETYNRRAITSLKLVENNEIDYTYKSTNRLLLNELYAMRQQGSDVLIVKKRPHHRHFLL